jgi:putative Mg2+ transporter-C (MgtC) family protein
MTFVLEDLIKVVLALILGGIIGTERETHSKDAGFRTITLITIGATIFTILSGRFGDPATSRIAANVVNGIGFLGAGAILFSEGKLKGLTTAASIWVAAALGMSIGAGEYFIALLTTAVMLVVLSLFSQLDRFLNRIGRETRAYKVVYTGRTSNKGEVLESLFSELKLRVRGCKRMWKEEDVTVVWELDGRDKDHQVLVDRLLGDKEIKEINY